eukprot:767870-Hanusia_phi.AAC.3
MVVWGISRRGDEQRTPRNPICPYTPASRPEWQGYMIARADTPPPVPRPLSPPHFVTYPPFLSCLNQKDYPSHARKGPGTMNWAWWDWDWLVSNYPETSLDGKDVA